MNCKGVLEDIGSTVKKDIGWNWGTDLEDFEYLCSFLLVPSKFLLWQILLGLAHEFCLASNYTTTTNCYSPRFHIKKTIHFKSFKAQYNVWHPSNHFKDFTNFFLFLFLKIILFSTLRKTFS